MIHQPVAVDVGQYLRAGDDGARLAAGEAPAEAAAVIADMDADVARAQLVVLEAERVDAVGGRRGVKRGARLRGVGPLVLVVRAADRQKIGQTIAVQVGRAQLGRAVATACAKAGADVEGVGFDHETEEEAGVSVVALGQRQTTRDGWDAPVLHLREGVVAVVQLRHGEVIEGVRVAGEVLAVGVLLDDAREQGLVEVAEPVVERVAADRSRDPALHQGHLDRLQALVQHRLERAAPVDDGVQARGRVLEERDAVIIRSRHRGDGPHDFIGLIRRDRTGVADLA